jgi:hypothetical protein
MPSTRPITAIVGVVTLIALAGCGSDAQSLDERQQEIAVAGAEVMPFDLDATTHIFTDTATGGTQDVVADDPSDGANIELIRRHMQEEAGKFRLGDFSDPEAIHGAAMPGLAVLEERFGDITVEFTHTDTGATITYRTDDPEVVRAIHDWFVAQSSDHGEHGSP